MADRFVDLNATGSNTGADWSNAFNTNTAMQDAYNAIASGDTIYAKAGVFFDDLKYYNKAWTLKLYGDVVIDSAGLNFRCLHHNATAPGRIITDGPVRTFTLRNADSNRACYYTSGGDITTSPRVMFVLKGNALETDNTARGADIDSTTDSILINISNLMISGFGEHSGVLINGSNDINGTIQNFIMDDCQRLVTFCEGSGNLTIVNAVIGASDDYLLDSSSTATNKITILNSILYPLKDIRSGENLLDDDGGVFQLGACDYYAQWYTSATLGSPGLDLGINRNAPLNNYLTNAYLEPRRPHYVSVSTDDYVNFEKFKDRADLMAAKGWSHNILLDDTVSVSQQDWVELKEYTNEGHQIVAHTRRETVWSENLYALNIANTTGADVFLNINVADDFIKIGSSAGADDLLSANLSGNLTNMFATISAVSGLTAVASTADITTISWGNSLANTLDDVVNVVIATGANSDFALNAQRHFDEEVAGCVADIENNVPDYNCQAFGYVGGFNSVVHNSLFYDFGLDGARSTIVHVPVDNIKNYGFLEKNYIYNSFAVNLDDSAAWNGTSSTMDETREVVYSLVLLAKQHGLHIDIYCHGDVEIDDTRFGYIIDALEECNANVISLQGAYESIRASAPVDKDDNYTCKKDFTKTDLLHFKNFAGATSDASGSTFKIIDSLSDDAAFAAIFD
jgi:hypothetical protein